MSKFNLENSVVLWQLFEIMRGHFMSSKGKATLSYDIKTLNGSREITVVELALPGSSCADEIQKALDCARDGVEYEAKRYN